MKSRQRQIGQIQLELGADFGQVCAECLVSTVDCRAAGNAALARLGPKPVAHAHHSCLRTVTVLMNVHASEIGDESLKAVLLGIEDEKRLVRAERIERFAA
jgi:hypothetical protein